MYYYLDCDTRHKLGSGAPPFICGVDRGSIGKPNLSWDGTQPPQYQVCVGNIAHLGNNHHSYGKVTGGTIIEVSQVEWDVAQKCTWLVKEQSELNRRRLATDLSKSITKLMETTNSWDDGEDRVRKSHPLSSNNKRNRRCPSRTGSKQERQKRRRDLYYEAIDRTTSCTYQHIDQYDEQCGKRWASSHSRPNRFPRMPNLPAAEQLSAPCYLHVYIDAKDNTEKATHLLKDC
jgi:hypothetical protein